MKKRIYLITVFALLLGCDNVNTVESVDQQATISKWFNNHTSALSLTYDTKHANSNWSKKLQTELSKLALVMDYEMVTNKSDVCYMEPDAIKYLRDTLSLNGFGYFGHGDKHDVHDRMEYSKAYSSFKACYDSMVNNSLTPISYAYPHGSGRKQSTQVALKSAGFLSGRAFTSDYEKVPTFHIMPHNSSKPENWYLLPTLRMESINYNNISNCINDNKDLLPILNQSIKLRSWIILTYHSIGGTGWGYTEYEDFIDNIHSIAERDFWSASMNDIVLYSYEREECEIDLDFEDDNKKGNFTVTLSDRFDDNDLFSHPLTVNISELHSVSYRVSLDGTVVDTITVENGIATVNLLPNERKYSFEEIVL